MDGATVEQEIWYPVPDLEDKVEISSHGRVRNKITGELCELRYGTELNAKGIERPTSVRCHALSGSPAGTSVHRNLIWAARGPIPKGKVVRHLDGDPYNNRLENLKVGTYKENRQDTFEHNTWSRRLDNALVPVIKELVNERWYTRTAVADALGCGVGVIKLTIDGEYDDHADQTVDPDLLAEVEAKLPAPNERKKWQHHRITVHGQQFASAEHAARHFGVGPASFRYWMAKDYTPEDAIELCKNPAARPPRKDYVKEPVTVLGTTYANRTDATRALGVDRKQFRKLLTNRDVTLNEAARLLLDAKSVNLDYKELETYEQRLGLTREQALQELSQPVPDLPSEVWEAIPEVGHHYASNLGRVKRVDGTHSRLVPPYIYTIRGRSTPRLRLNGTGHQLGVWVALAFLGPKPTQNHMLCHRDDNPFNNRIDNLYWGTAQNNIDDRVKNGTMTYVTDEQAEEAAKMFEGGMSLAAIGRHFDIRPSMIKRALKRIGKYHKPS